MKKIFPYLCLFVAMLLPACQNNTIQPAKDRTIIQVGPSLVDCTGVGLMQCMQIKKPGQSQWELFYGSIDGFTFTSGYLYKLDVKVTKRAIPIPADDSSQIWSLVKIIKKQKVEN